MNSEQNTETLTHNETLAVKTSDINKNKRNLRI